MQELLRHWMAQPSCLHTLIATVADEALRKRLAEVLAICLRP